MYLNLKRLISNQFTDGLEHEIPSQLFQGPMLIERNDETIGKDMRTGTKLN